MHNSICTQNFNELSLLCRDLRHSFAFFFFRMGLAFVREIKNYTQTVKLHPQVLLKISNVNLFQNVIKFTSKICSNQF